MPALQPPKPRLALRVGVTGHKPEHLQHADIGVLQQQIHKVLQILKQFALDHPRVSNFYRDRDEPVLRLVTSLAEGADRYAAHQALSLGYELQCPLPFVRDQYANDFEQDASVQEFNRLLDHTLATTAVLELDGSRDHAAESYLAAGRLVLSQSDVLLAIWDGQGPRDQDCTAQIVTEAALRNILTIRIDSADPHHDIFYPASGDERDTSDKAMDGLLDQLRTLLNPPRHSKKEKDEEFGTTPQSYFSEKQRWLNRGLFWIPFRNLWLLHPTLPQIRVPDFGVAGADEWVAVLQNSEAFSDSAIGRIDSARLCDHYGWANGLAEYYGNLYRSAFAINYIFGALAVFCAFLHYALESRAASLVLIITELLLLLAIPIIYFVGRWRRWHEKWIDFRLLAEYLRQLFFLLPLGPGELSSPRLPKYLSAGDPKSTWMYWHYLALRREIGMVGGEFSATYLNSVRSFLNSKAGIRGQIEYHENNAERLEKLDSRFRNVGIGIFVGAFFAAIIALVILVKEMLHPDVPISRETREIVVGLVATAAPAFGAALAGIRTQAEFERVKKRSRATLQTLRRICKELVPREEGREEISYSALNLIVAEAGQLMVDELLDWRIVFKDRPLPEPG